MIYHSSVTPHKHSESEKELFTVFQLKQKQYLQMGNILINSIQMPMEGIKKRKRRGRKKEEIKKKLIH